MTAALQFIFTLYFYFTFHFCRAPWVAFYVYKADVYSFAEPFQFRLNSLHQESGGSARTDYRAIQLAKKKKQRGPSSSSGERVVPAQSREASGHSCRTAVSDECVSVDFPQGVRGRVREKRKRRRRPRRSWHPLVLVLAMELQRPTEA